MQSPQTRLLNLPVWQRTLYLLFFTQLVNAIAFSIIFPFFPLYVEQLGSAFGFSIEMLAGLVFSAQAATMMIASPIWGSVADRFGRKLMIQRAQFGGAVLLTLMAYVQNAEQLVLLRAIQGFVTGTAAANNALIASIIPRKHTGYAMGLMQVGMGAGVALGPLIGGMLADAFGYQAAFYGTGLLLLISGLLVTFGVHENFNPKQKKALYQSSLTKEYRHVLSAEGVVPTYSLRFLSQMARMMIIPIAPFIIQTLVIRSFSINTFIGLVLGISSGATTLSAIFLGKLGDRIGHRKVLISSAAAAGLLYLPQYFVTQGWHILTLQALAGVALGGVLPTISALLACYTDSGEEGTVYGLDNSINAAGRAVAPLIGGLVASWFSYRSTFIATSLILILAVLAASSLLPKTGRLAHHPT